MQKISEIENSLEARFLLCLNEMFYFGKILDNIYHQTVISDKIVTVVEGCGIVNK